MSARFATIPAIALEDERISHACLRVLATLGKFIDKRGWCWPSLATLAAEARMRRDEICRHLKNLQIWGYLHRVQGGGRKTTGYMVKLDFPASTSTDEPDYPGRTSTDEPYCCSTADPDCCSTAQPYPERTIERPIEHTNPQRPSPRPESDPSHPQPNGRGRYRFEEFWDCWDIPGSKVEKRAAETKYRDLIKAAEVTHDELCDGVRRYMAWCRRERKALQYIKGPVTWMHRGCWEDELKCQNVVAMPKRKDAAAAYQELKDIHG